MFGRRRRSMNRDADPPALASPRRMERLPLSRQMVICSTRTLKDR
jgi:hypothetical protein